MAQANRDRQNESRVRRFSVQELLEAPGRSAYGRSGPPGIREAFGIVASSVETREATRVFRGFTGLRNDAVVAGDLAFEFKLASDPARPPG